LIITTNLNISALTNPETIKDKRIYSRILEICSPIIFTGENRRIEKMKEKSKLAYEILKKE
ncbi:TPA: DNA replication protein, partial [Clostridioides difficile]|nr:DNA replication protein [Clostridioides difficile]